MEPVHLPVEELPFLPSEIEQELADLARGVLPPKLNFPPLRKATVDRALADLGFATLGTSWVLDIRGFRVAVELFRDKANRAFCFDLGLQPLNLWDDAVHASYPAHAAMFRGRIMPEDNRCWWKHGLDRDRSKEVLTIAADYLRSRLLAELDQLVDFLDSAAPDQLSSPPLWLDPLFCDAIVFARYRHAEGRLPEAAAFARQALAAMGNNPPPAGFRPPSPVELEMRALAGA